MAYQPRNGDHACSLRFVLVRRASAVCTQDPPRSSVLPLDQARPYSRASLEKPVNQTITLLNTGAVLQEAVRSG